MKRIGIRQAKAHLSQLVRAAAAGECIIVTDNKKPVAMIGPRLEDPDEPEAPPKLTQDAKPPSDSMAFREALLSAPFPLELDF